MPQATGLQKVPTLRCSSHFAPGTFGPGERWIFRERQRAKTMEERNQNNGEFGDGSNPYKRRKENGEEEQEQIWRVEDRISTLPDSLILRILSLLPMHEVIKTSALSKRWQHLWPLVPDLIFRHHGIISRQQFVSFVSKTLALRRRGCTSIHKFSVNFGYEPGCAADIDMWIEIAAESKVEVLELLVMKVLGWRPIGLPCSYRLPEKLYKNSSIREMKLLTSIVEPIGIISWSSLKKLYFDAVKMNNDVIERILSGCPVLEFLELRKFSGFNRLHVTSPNLRQLCVREYILHEREDKVPVEIFAPHIRSLEISNCDSWKMRLLNVSSLVDAFLDFYPKVINDWEECGNMLLEVLESVHNVKNLTLGTWCIQVMLLLRTNGLPSPLLKCKSLKLLAGFMKWELPGIAHLLQSSPYVETLDINISPYLARRHFFKSRDCDGEKFFPLQEHNSKCLLLHLKCVKIFCDRFPCQELVQYVLTHASALEKMIIYSETEGRCSDSPLQAFDKMLSSLHREESCHSNSPAILPSDDGSSRSFTSPESLQVAQMLESFPRSSPHAVVKFVGAIIR